MWQNVFWGSYESHPTWKPSHTQSPRCSSSQLALIAPSMALPRLNGEEMQQEARKAVIIFKVEQDFWNQKTPWKSLGRFFVWEFWWYSEIPSEEIKKNLKTLYCLDFKLNDGALSKLTATFLTSQVLLWVTPIPKYSSLGRKYPSTICSKPQRPQQRGVSTSRKHFLN